LGYLIQKLIDPGNFCLTCLKTGHFSNTSCKLSFVVILVYNILIKKDQRKGANSDLGIMKA